MFSLNLLQEDLLINGDTIKKPEVTGDEIDAGVTNDHVKKD